MGWYGENLAQDFLSCNPDGSLVDRAGFLARMAPPYPGTNLEALDVRIRVLGEIAIIHAGLGVNNPLPPAIDHFQKDFLANTFNATNHTRASFATYQEADCRILLRELHPQGSHGTGWLSSRQH